MDSEFPLSTVDDELARERGRVLAARAIAENPDQRKRIEATFGRDYCMRRYPECYAAGFGAFLDKVLPFKL
jgi:hypothetical protein